jgi:hypothetical protein
MEKGCPVSDPVSLAMIDFLTWVSSRPRTYAETMDAWRSSCPRHTVWEDALTGGFIQIESGDTPHQMEVALTPLGQAVLGRSHSRQSAQLPTPGG